MIRENVRYKALSPISHNGDETLSNTVPFRRQSIVVDSEVEEVPVISGNSIRGIWRRIGARHLLDTLGINEDECSVDLYHKLATGGSLSSSKDDIQALYRREVREKVPFLSIFGTALDSFILKGKIISGFLYPICKQTQKYTAIKTDDDIYKFISTEFYTRKDDYEEACGEELEKSDQMIYEGEVLIAGTEFNQTLIIDSPHPREIGCFFKIMQLFKEKPFIGGVSRAGHGQVEFDIDFSKYEKEIKDYENYLEENKEELKEFLLKL